MGSPFQTKERAGDKVRENSGSTTGQCGLHRMSKRHELGNGGPRRG